MARIRWSLALLALGLAATDLWAHGFFFLPPAGYGYVRGGGLAFGRFGRHDGVSFAFGGASGGFYYNPYVSPFFPVTRQVTVVYYAPPVVVMPPPGVPLDGFLPDEPRDRLVEPKAPAPPPDRFRIPASDDRVPPIPPPAKPKSPPPRTEPKRAPRPPELPRPPQPEEDPVFENARLVTAGRLAFARREYGRAAERFRQATQLAPQKPLAHFLLAQALLALGKYREAVDALHAGLAANPNWPAAPFRPSEPYGANAADYAEHLRRLQGLLAQFPDDPALLFLYAYQLWFDGRKDDARQLFRRARPRAANPGDIDLFLREKLSAISYQPSAGTLLG